MRSMKQLGILAAFALFAIGASNASAAEFTASATGSLEGKALETQVFTFNGGKLECNGLESSGTIAKTADTRWHWKKKFSVCVLFGIGTVHVAEVTVELTSNLQLHINSTIALTPTVFGFSACTLTVTPQTVGTVDVANSGSNNVKVSPTVTGLAYHSTGGACGASGNNGTYSGASELNRVGGGTLRFDS